MKGISESFKTRANEAAFWEAWVGSVLSRANLYTIHFPFAADGKDNHALSWDLSVATTWDGPYIPVECKSLSAEFLGPDSYPYERVLTCSLNSWTKKWGKNRETQRDFLFISKPTGCIVWLPTGVTVTETKVTDRSRGETYGSLQCDRKALRPFFDFIEHVKESAK